VGEADSKGENFVVINDYTFSLHEKAKLREMIEAYYGKSMQDEQELDLLVLMDKPCVISLAEGESGSGKKFVEVTSVVKPTKSLTVDAATRSTFVWDFELHDGTGDPRIPEWIPLLYGRSIVEEIKRSPEWAELLACHLATTPQNGQTATVDDEDVPF
jgi:hypothetical protein